MSTSAFAQRNPPRSLWLQLVHRTGCLTRRARPLKLTSFLYKSYRRSRGRQDAIDFVTIALPSLRSLRHLHRKVSFTCYATSPAWRYATECHAFSYCAHKAHARRKQANRCRSCKDKSAVFVVWEEEHKEPKRTTATSCGWSNGACVRRVRRSYARRRCGSCSVFERANSVYK